MLDDTLNALAEPRRRAILRLLRSHERPAGDIAAHFEDVTRPAISQHLKILADARLVAVRRVGRKRLYRLHPEGLRDLRTFLDEIWDDQLLRLKAEAEADERSKHGEPPP